MPTPKNVAAPEEKLVAAIKDLQRSVEHAKEEISLSNQFPRNLLSSFLKGVMYGIGTLTVIAVLIPFGLWFLQSIHWPPLVADFITQVIEQVDRADHRPAGAAGR